jgi:hypothetical protein
MRGPLLSGPLGSAAALRALARLTEGLQPVVLLGSLWLGEALAEQAPVLMLVEPDERAAIGRVRRRAVKAGRPLTISLAAADVPLRRGSLGALVLEDVAGLEPADAERWLSALVPCLRPGGRLVAADATSNPAGAARVAGAFLAAALIDPSQESPRDGVVLTVGAAPASEIVAARFGAGASGSIAAPA